MRRLDAYVAALLVLWTGGVLAAAGQAKQAGVGENPDFRLKKPSIEYIESLKRARAANDDYFFQQVIGEPDGLTYGRISEFLAPIRYVNAPWRYAGVILSPKGSTQKFRVIENGFQVDANLTRRSPMDVNKVWAAGDRHLWVLVGAHDELFGADEGRQGNPGYEDGYLPVLHVSYKSGGVMYEETVLASKLKPEYRSPYIDESGIAAYIRITATNGDGRVAFQVQGPPVGYGFPIVPGGMNGNAITDEHNNVFAWFSDGFQFDGHKNLVRYSLRKGESAYVVVPHHVQLAGTSVVADAKKFESARQSVRSAWIRELNKGGSVQVPEKVVMDAYRSLLIGDWQVSVGDELPYGMFSWYQGNGYAEILQTIAPFIEFGYFEDARRFIQPILEYPLSDTGVGLHVVANRIELAAYYYTLSRDSDFIRKNQLRLTNAADYFLEHRDASTGLVKDGYAFDEPDKKVYNINTNTNGWRAVRDLGLVLMQIGESKLGRKYLNAAEEMGPQIRKAIQKNTDHSTDPPFVPFALGDEHPYKSLVESRASSYYNIVMPYFFESEIFAADSEPYSNVLNYMWKHQGVMAGLNRFDGHGTLFGQDGIHPLYTWGRQFSQISRREADRVVYTFYSSLANGYTRGTFLTGECQETVPSENQWYRGTYLPPEPPANALLLRSLRHMLIHENDRDQDGEYDELWLLSSTPAEWLASGKNISLEKMPTRFGRISLDLHRSADGKTIRGTVDLPTGITNKTVLLYLHTPESHNTIRAQSGDGRSLALVRGSSIPAIAIPARAGKLHFTVTLAD